MPAPPSPLWVVLALVLQDGREVPVAPLDPAQESARPPDEYVLDPLLVTPTLRGGSRHAAPFAAEEVSAEQIETRAYRTVPQALRDVPGVLVQETAHGHGSPYLRGFTSFRNLFLIDGIRLNNSVFRPGPNQYWNTVDPWSLDRLEVVMGPSSVLYGSDAMGGTVQALTKSPWAEMSGEGDGGWGGRLAYRWADAENYDQARVEAFGPVGERTAVGLGLSWKDYGDLHGGADVGLQRNTGYDEVDADVKVEHELGESTLLTVAHQRVRQNDVPRTHRTVDAIDWEGLTVGSDLRRDFDQDRRLTYVQVDAGELDGVFDRVVTSLSYHEQDEVRHRTRSSGALEDQGFDVGTLGFFTHLFRDTDAGRWTYGVEYYRDEVDSFLDKFGDQSAADDIQGPVADDATYETLGVFVQDEIQVTERTELTLGARWNRIEADADSVRDPVTDERISIRDDWQAVVASARFVHQLRPESLNLYGGVSQGFRAPNLSDLSRFDSARTNEFEVPAPDLDPETTTTLELGLKSLSPRTTSQVAVFYTDIQDRIDRVPTGNVNGDGELEVTKDNVGDGYVYGIEVGATHQLDDVWSVFGNATYLEGKVDTFATSAPVVTEEYLTRLMPLTARLGLRWAPADAPGWIEGMVTWADDADRLSPSDERDTSRIPEGGTPGYVTLDLRSGWSLRDDLSLTLGVENLTDEDYRIHGSGVNRPGRNLVAGLSWSF